MHRTWADRLDEANTETEVLAVAQDFLAAIDSFEVDQLPSACRPRKLARASDLTSYAFDVVRCQFGKDDECGPLIAGMAFFFAKAANRLAGLRARKDDDVDLRRA